MTLRKISQTAGIGGADLASFAVVLLVGIAAGRLPVSEAFSGSYSTPLYYTATTVSQVLSVILLGGLLLILRNKERVADSAEADGPIPGAKGTVMSSFFLVLALIILPFSEDIYRVGRLAQGTAVFLVAGSVWALFTTVADLFSGLERNRERS